jgi:hypothetical protein
MTVFEIQPDILTPDDYADGEFELKTDNLCQTNKAGLRTATPHQWSTSPFGSKLIPDSLAQQARNGSTP